MGDHGVWTQLNDLHPNGLLPAAKTNVTQALDADRWLKAEVHTTDLIARIQPNPSSEERRNAVASYVQRLITECLSCPVFTFGSVPLKTYLPDGDIDLTAFGDNENMKDTWAAAVCAVLEKEEKNENAEFQVKEIKYIQAEVKLIKCLVENIVVDISFNQVGGLCTLCFLEEMDKVIDRNHLFKRSIILIKAWCYYESRILGAHHGLISTYALETLVLYVFHVFNNSFLGPLEVLYRFLEFFSNFDWDNYCISLRGPVPIRFLPDISAEPPRKDDGKLLFTKDFIDKSTAEYSVMPGGQENHSQPFVSKHFNVIDPLRTNNNLGRSVSKGNFTRIRSAFAFGAKRLARLLDCPKDAIIMELNEFFTNALIRHGTGNRPDVHSLNLQPFQQLKTLPIDSKNLNTSTSVRKKFENGILRVVEEHFPETSQSSLNSVNEMICNQEMYKANTLSVVAHDECQTSRIKQINSGCIDQLGRSHGSTGFVQSSKTQKTLKYNYSVNPWKEQGKLHFVRTRSSPNLTETCLDLSRARHSRAMETLKVQSQVKFDSGISRKNMGSEMTSSHNSKSFDDYTSKWQIASHKNFDMAFDTNNVSNSHQGYCRFSNMGDELASVSETLEMQQEEQDLVNMMGSSDIHSFNGQVTYQMPIAAYSLPLTFSPVPTSMGYAKRNLDGVLPSNLPPIGAPWMSSMQFNQSLTSFPLYHYINVATFSSNADAIIDSSNDGSAVVELKADEVGHNHLKEDEAVLSRGSNPGHDVSLDKNQQKLKGSLTLSPTARDINYCLTTSPTGRGIKSGLSREYDRVGREDRSLIREDTNASFQPKTTKGDDIQSNSWTANPKLFPLALAHSSRGKSVLENHRDKPSATSESAREKWGRRSSSSVSPSPHGKDNGRLQFEGSSDNGLVKVNNDVPDWISSTAGNDMPERVTESASLVASVLRSQHLLGHESEQNQSDSLTPFAPVLVGTSEQRVTDYCKFIPTFVATGPPVPYLVFPFGNFTSNSGKPDGYAGQLDREEESDQFQASPEHHIDLLENLEQSKAIVSPTVSRNSASEFSKESASDILNSDLNGHQQNLVYGRFCQNPYNGTLFYSSPPFVGSQIYLPSHYPCDGPGRSLTANLNYAQPMGYSSRLMPVMPLQSGPGGTFVAFQHNVDEAPKHRAGTGTYLPNPKVSYRDRQTNLRNRGSWNYDHNDPGDRPRAFDRHHSRNQSDRASSRPDRLPAAKKS
ncbi:uncharacterized protein LOC122045627 isoform X1 [Zingiber officinale]|uniref:uncharacterized protein LOC122045627 isoform X1 n=1 Tax=Zingiber officinale TaxID=94328 RepID=UPI001C4AEF05|nr:uncharacterized protein LOC122045627 isoform X1 [Zingiber officinale]XP_042461863.1 uncharacterized protein LOC122045627 isoform X1 [Zingiber officinale]XP_042461864.1 uncharacterized protein LOC122045627 isoform X1 [Zingiber officinale]XP_042461865.1 uncharacterized protein LOC122045627 isoform X1 [Zingiber officinale]XP_042461866.1 uncharacterized protein LOC122045627 isoform X1 [Zingiber officinale]XP_042461867.1 uncharacterized protein LOC122045627 isoform X1 [Zingiber officinale]XP_04